MHRRPDRADRLHGSWFTGQLIYAEYTLDQLHPGYFIPTVAGGLLASVAAVQVGQTGLAWVLFGYGMIAWLVIGSIILGRLFFGLRLPEALVPTLAIQVAPGAVASLAWFSLDGGRIDTVARLFAGYGVLMVVAQVRLLPAYLRLRFSGAFWAFAFSWTAVATVGLHWIRETGPAGGDVGAALVLAAATLLVGAIAVRTVVALYRGEPVPARRRPRSTVVRRMEESRMSEKSDLVVHRANDVGGRAPGGPLTRDEHEIDAVREGLPRPAQRPRRAQARQHRGEAPGGRGPRRADHRLPDLLRAVGRRGFPGAHGEGADHLRGARQDDLRPPAAVGGGVVTARFGVGERVRIATRDAPGHVRTPVYVRGHVGVVERVLPVFLDPEQEAYGVNSGTGIQLYRVRIPQAALWPAYRGNVDDVLELEVYEHWLEPAEEDSR